jgi:predicted RNA-binding Zn-ribbon protein involved in translation (DUF1610 family)
MRTVLRRIRIGKSPPLRQGVKQTSPGFYLEVATFQRSVEQAVLPALPLDSPELDRILQPHFDRLLILMKRIAPPQVSQEVPFLRRLLLQPYAECQARRGGISRASVQPLCPFCGEQPVVAALRPAGDGGKRSLICSLCATEWDFRRMLCPRCGEADQEKLPIYTAALSGIRLFERHAPEDPGEAKLIYEDLPAVVTDLGIKELTYAGTEAQLRRTAAG